VEKNSLHPETHDPEAGIRSNLSVEIAFVAAVLALLVMVAASCWSVAASRESDRWVKHTHEVLEALQDMRLEIQTVQSSTRGFALTGRDSYLAVRRAGVSDIFHTEAVVRALTADNPPQQRRVAILQTLIKQRIDLTEVVIEMRQTRGLEAAAHEIGTGQRATEVFQAVIGEMRGEEARLLVLRDAEAKARAKQVSIVLVTGSFLIFLLTFAAGWKLRRDNAARKEAFAEQKLLERALFAEKERAQVTLNSIGDAVACTDASGNISFLNRVAEQMSGWSRAEAMGRPMAEVLQIIDATTRAVIPNPMELAIAQNRSMNLPLNCLLVGRDGCETPIEDTVSPIHGRGGETAGAVIVFRDVSDARGAALHTAHMAAHDVLTGLPNRMLLNDRVRHAIALAQRHNKPVAMLFLDLDGFKHINDSLGHSVGDKLLKSIATRLLACVRDGDTVSRQGGDEFVVLLSEIEESEDAAVMAKRLLQAVAMAHPIDGHDLHVTTSIGVSIYPEDGRDAETLIKNADTAMYQAKENGRQTYRFFKPAMNARAVERQSIEGSLRRALERKEFILHYQPRVDLVTRKITGAEALIRWVHPTRGLLSPAQFISVAEDCGLILPIGSWVLRAACWQTRIWKEADLHLDTMAVNVSAMEFRGDGFLEGVFASLRDTGLNPRSLELELTESVVMKHAASSEEILNTLRATRIRLSVDDFGTGYSSLSYLSKFPLDALKIDQSFVRQITAADGETAIVSAVIGMGQSLNLRIVAEGVETRDELAFLQAHGCDEAQGYYFSPPLPAEQFAKLLEAGIPDAAFPQRAGAKKKYSVG
jgi:diguanylate cyclase (GGDEF)-like protein/PAS domain S-box-containing protein